MAKDIIKLIVAIATLFIIGALLALFASGYISAFKPGGTKDTAGNPVHDGSSGLAGGNSSSSYYSPPSPTPSKMPVLPAGPGQGYQPQNVPMTPALPTPMAPEEPVYMPPQFMPSQQQPSAKPVSPDKQQGESWFDPGGIREKPVDKAPQMPSTPITQPLVPGISRQYTPNETGWMQIVQQLYSILPYIFSRSYPVMPWWTPGW